MKAIHHMANLFLTKSGLELQEKIWQILEEEPEADGGVTRLTTQDLAVRIFGNRAQKLQQIAEKIKNLYVMESNQTFV